MIIPSPRKNPQTLLLILSFCFFCLTVTAVAQQESFPFLAEVTADGVNVRAGQNANFERLCRLKKFDEVVVVGRDYNWYKIQLPPETEVSISGKYVRLLNYRQGELTVDHVNVRARSDVNATILGQLDKGVRLRIREKREGWYKIEPPANVYGWVSDQFLAFKSKDVPPAGVWTPQSPQTEETALASSQKIPAERISVTGYLRPRGKDAGYELMIDDRSAYDVQGFQDILEEFAHRKVNIEGTIDTKGPYPRPVITVSKIRLVL